MAPSRKDCLDEIARKTGRPRKDVEDLLEEIFDRASEYEAAGAGPDMAYAQARDEMLKEIGERAALRRRAEILDQRREIARHRFYSSVAQQIDKLPIGEKWRARLRNQAARLALEAKLVGVNLPFEGNRGSVDAQFVALRKAWVGGLSRDLDQAGLLKVFASRALEDKWTDELFELNRPDGNPGITKDAHALAIAKTIQKWQRDSINALNDEGAWVRSYSGYITRTSHDPDAIRGPNGRGLEKWVADTLPRLDLKRTFGTTDMQRAKDMLRQMWGAMKNGDHFDYGKPLEDPIYPSVAGKASAERELHFKSGADWRAYNELYGVHDATRTVVEAIATAARRKALMSEFGTRPKEAFDRDVAYLKATLQAETNAMTSRLGALEEAARSPAAAGEAKAKIEADMAGLVQRIAEASGRFEDFASFEQAARNRFAQIDGSSKRPVSRLSSQLVNNAMAIQRMAKLGRVALTHFASLPTKALEARYWGIPFSERYASLFRGLTQGLEGSEKRQALDLTLVAFENRLGHMMATYDVADAPAGFLAKWESTFFKLTGVSSVIDNQRGDAEAMFAAHLGSKRGQAWADIGRKEQRVVRGYNLGEAEWKALHGVEWTKIGDRTYLTPSDALKLSDDQVRAYLKEAKSAELGRLEPTAADLNKARNDLATKLAAAYSDRAGFAIPMPSARIRAMLFGKNFEPGTPLNNALRLVLQFKIWPADMVVRAWGREMYGTIGDTRMDKFAGIAEAAVGGILFGVASEAVREAIQGRDPIHELRDKPLAAITRGAERSGFGSLLGDYLLGEYDRHGLSAVAQLAGPTVSQLDTLMGILHGNGDSFLNAIAGIDAGKQSAHPWRERLTSLVKLVHDNTPFQSLWLTSLAADTLIWHRLQEWINPGYLQRSQRRQEQVNGTKYIVSPAATDRWITGHGPAPFHL